MPLIIAAFGIHGLFTKSDKMKWGLVPMALGASLFYVLAFIFVPLMGTHGLGQHPYEAHYSDLNMSLLTRPIKAVQQIATVERLQWLKSLLGPLFLSLLSPGILFLALPIMMQHFLSNVTQEHTIYFSYAVTIAPFIFLAFINTLGKIKEKFSKGRFYLILFITMAWGVIYCSQQMDYIKIRYMAFNSPATATYGWQALNMVPPKAPVIATFRFLPELSQRPYVYSFHKIYDPTYQNKNYSYKLPENVHYALIDFNDAWLSYSLKRHRQATRLKIKDFLLQGAWKVKYSAAGIVLFER